MARPGRLASRTTRRTRWATSSSSTCPRWATALEAGKIFGSVESVKAVSDLFSPVTGTVTAINEELKDAPEKDQRRRQHHLDAEARSANPAELDALLSAAQYEAFVAEETGK
jgi:glycine cleavage system H protein